MNPRALAEYAIGCLPVHSPAAPPAESFAGSGDWMWTTVVEPYSYFAYSGGFASAMHALPNVLLVGDTTGGGSGNPAVYPLQEGHGFSVSRWIEFTTDRRPIEGSGIAPARAVAFHDGEVIAGRDETLRYAFALVARLRQSRDMRDRTTAASAVDRLRIGAR